MRYPFHNYLSSYVAVIVLSVTVLLGCKKTDGFNEPVSTDKTPPGVVTNTRVVNFNGGAHIIYTLPSSPNLLYVQADYNINERTARQTKSSYYTDTITVNGFAESKDYTVLLRSVSRANVLSEPVSVTVHPAVPYFALAFPTLQLTADFGGVNVRALNESNQAFGYILLEKNAAGRYDIRDQHYSNVDTVNYSVRGYNTQSRDFAAYITDQYGNNSDTVFASISPLFETLLNKNNFFNYPLSSDTEIGYGWNVPYLWDNKTDNYSSGWHTNPGGTQPMICTFGLGAFARLSRFVLYNRPDQFSYSHGNAKRFTIWGSDKTSPQNATMPVNSAVGTVVGDWVNIGNYRFPDPPSGAPSTAVTASDIAFVAAGVNFNVALTSPKVRFIRYSVAETWSGGDFAHAMEISFYGDPQ